MRRHKWLSSFVLFSASLPALPQDPSPIHGKVHIEASSAAHLEVYAGDRAIIEWKSFSVAQGETIQFIQPQAAAVLNRVTSGMPSEIFGRLQANGSVYLINPAGILIGKEGLIKTAGFLASALDLPNDQFIAGKNLHLQSSSDGSVINLGTIKSGGDVYLLGSHVCNKGKILAENDRAFLGAGRDILLQSNSDLPLYIRPHLDADAKISLENDGLIRAIRTELIAAGRPQALAISNTGRIDALYIKAEEGKIFLRADQGEIISTGKLEAKKSIDISSDTLHLREESLLSSPKGGVHLQTQKIFTHAGSISAKTVDIRIEKESPFVHTGSIEAIETINIQAPNFLNAGLLKTETGGKISIDILSASIETSAAHLSARMGSITHHAGTIFSSGHYDAGTRDRKRKEGSIEIFADRISLIGAHLDAGGALRSGKITIGKTGRHSVLASELYLGYTTRLQSDELDLAPAAIWQENLSQGLCATAPGSSCNFTNASEFINPDPTSSGFGAQVLPLSTGNVVITNPNDNFAASGAGAAYLFNGVTGALISTLTGSSSNDDVSNGGVFALTGNGNYVLSSTGWSSGKGAATWGSGARGVSGVVSSSNSIVGSTGGDLVSFGGITSLSNGNYVVSSPVWNSSEGAATWGDGSTGTTGAVSSGNSLVGSVGGDAVSGSGITALVNGNYVVRSANWSGYEGAATWGNGSSGISGTISSGNSLVGTINTDSISYNQVTALTNGNYVVASASWSGGEGAATWGNGSSGISGTVSSGNSLVGSLTTDFVSETGVTALTNGNYVVASASWSGGEGAATWGNGSSGISGTVSSGNSLVGTLMTDAVSSHRVTALTNGNYVVSSASWNGSKGAATWGNGSTGTTGTVSTSNSLVGSIGGDAVCIGGSVALTNGNYVVQSRNWNSNTGAATWGNGTMGTTGTVSISNSLVGSISGDQVSSGENIALTNGNYVVSSPNWNSNIGAATWGNGTTGTAGTISSSNSLVGSTSGDQVANGENIALTNGNYVLISSNWNSDRGAATWGNGTTGTFGVVSSSNSLIGGESNDFIASGDIVELPTGCYAVVSPNWTNPAGSLANAGAVTPASSSGGTTGVVSSLNSIVGVAANSGLSGVVYNSAVNSLIIPFTTEGNGRVFFVTLGSLLPSVPVPSYGLYDFRISLSETFQNWGPYLFGGLLNQDDYVPYLSYKQVEPKIFPSLLKRPLENQTKVYLRRGRYHNRKISLAEDSMLEIKEGKILKGS